MTSNIILSITHTCNTKKWSLKKAVAETSQTNILVLYRVSFIILCSVYIYIYIYYVCVYTCVWTCTKCSELIWSIILIDNRKKFNFQFSGRCYDDSKSSAWYMRDNSFNTFAKFTEKQIFRTPVVRTRTCAYQGVDMLRMFSGNLTFNLTLWKR